MTDCNGPALYPVTARTKGRRRDRMVYDREAVHAVLDEALVCHVGFVDETGQPHVIPTIHWRIGETLYLHGAKASRLLKVLGGGAAACVTVSLLDGLVLARSAFHHSMNYRSVIAYGRFAPVDDPAEKARVLDPLTDKLVAGRSTAARPVNDKELAATAVVAMPLEEVVLKTRTGGVIDDVEDMDLPVWAGILPLRLTAGTPEPDADLAAGVTAGMPGV